ncbi:MAG: Gfo/Idh/MocA family oxidoreductase, partial [Anaerolineales bacterium]|nr:Gfo/Idh/MocA family oxidoreductase [Anaerolineales bacterium]
MAEFQKSDGMNYAPQGKVNRVINPGEFRFAAIGLDHGHIFGMCNGLLEAGAELAWVYDPDPAKVANFCARYPTARVAHGEDEILQDASIRLIASAAIPADRCALGLRALDAGKDYFSDKPPLTTLAQLDAARAKVQTTGRKYAAYYSERIHSEAGVYAGELIQNGAIGRVIQVIGLGPHRISLTTRPEWFFQKDRYGGILCDIGSHQIEQFLFYANAQDARVSHSRIANYHHP